jgi:CoA:oxalate CoA-transferase
MPIIEENTGPLSGIRVVDLTQIYNGPYATFLLAMAGAEVVKVEPPGGEHTRKRQRDGGGAQIPHAMLNSGKKFVVLDLKTPEGKQQLEQLIVTGDVLVENFRPGVMDRLNFSLERVRELNPHIIYASSSGFGSTGPQGVDDRLEVLLVDDEALVRSGLRMLIERQVDMEVVAEAQDGLEAR